MPTGEAEATGQDAESVLFVFIHGWGSHPGSYADSLDAIQRLGCQVYAPTLPGHAGTPMLPKDEQSLACIAEQLEAEILRASRGRHIVLSGHSLGGAVSTLLCERLSGKGADVSLLLLSSTGANPQFGPRQWIRALTDLIQPRPHGRRKYAGVHPGAELARTFRTRKMGWEARCMDLMTRWQSLIEKGLSVTAVHALDDRVVDTEPLMSVPGAQTITVMRPHDWPVWDAGVFAVAAAQHLSRLKRH